MMYKQNVVNLNSEILFCYKKNEVLIYTTKWMNFENITLCERNHTQKATSCMIFFFNEMLKIGNSIKTE